MNKKEIFYINKIVEELKCESSGYYYISLMFNNKIVLSDQNIVKKIGIVFEEYSKQLLKFNAKKFDDGMYFENKEDCEIACQYLNEIYGPLIKLTGG